LLAAEDLIFFPVIGTRDFYDVNARGGALREAYQAKLTPP
jgi:hypothetical protein